MKRLLLLGGGHSHVEVLRRLGHRPIPGIELTFVSRARHFIYTGMLPGLIAGHYAAGDCQIDLDKLARFAGATFVAAVARRVDIESGRVILDDGTLAYDFLSVDVGSTPDTSATPGAAEHALVVKPFETFLPAWEGVLERAARGEIRRLAVVGGGAGGVEIALAAHHRLAALRQSERVRFSLITDAHELLATHNARVRRAFSRILSARGISVHLATRIVRVEPGALVARTGDRIAADAAVWATGASPPPLLHGMAVARDAAGFIAVTPNLQSASHAHVFAAGDCASIPHFRLPKSGVYAVREGPILAANLRRALAGRPLTAYRPQRLALALIASGDRCAVASYGRLELEGAWVWRWKDRIDRRFIARYGDLRTPRSDDA